MDREGGMSKSINKAGIFLIAVGLVGLGIYFLYSTPFEPAYIDEETSVQPTSTTITLIQPPHNFRRESRVYRVEGIITHQLSSSQHQNTIWLIDGEIRDLAGPDFRPARFQNLILVPDRLLRPPPKEEDFFSSIKDYRQGSFVTIDVVFCGHNADLPIESQGPTDQPSSKGKIFYKATKVYYPNELMAPYYLQ